MIHNRTYVLQRDDYANANVLDVIEQQFTNESIRWFVSEADDKKVVIESTEYDTGGQDEWPDLGVRTGASRDAIVSIIPTGIGCEIGGYAGDASPATALLSASADVVITNPNAVNASNFINIDDNVLYTEGFGIDMLMRGKAELYRPRFNRVGIIIEGGDDAAVANVFNIVNAIRAVHGVNIEDCIITPTIGTRCIRSASGAYIGGVDHPDTLLKAARQLIERGVDAIAITTNVQDLPDVGYAEHFKGGHPNPVGGAEAVISHLVTRNFAVPSAHAPMVNFHGSNLSRALPTTVVDPRSAGEFVSSSGLACVLIGLSNAPQLVRGSAGSAIPGSIGLNDLIAVVAPADALGGVPVLYASRFGIPIIGVAQNRTIIQVQREALGLANAIIVNSYAEAAGTILALRKGLSLSSLIRPMPTLRPRQQEGFGAALV